MRGRVHAIRTLKGLVADLRFIIHILYYYIYLILLLSYKLENKKLDINEHISIRSCLYGQSYHPCILYRFLLAQASLQNNCTKDNPNMFHNHKSLLAL